MFNWLNYSEEELAEYEKNLAEMFKEEATYQ